MPRISDQLTVVAADIQAAVPAQAYIPLEQTDGSVRSRKIASTELGTLCGALGTKENTFSSASSWVVNHNLGYKPAVKVYSSGSVEMLAQVTHNSVNQFTVSFAAATAGFVRYF